MKSKKIINYKSLSRELQRLFLKIYGSDYENSITEFFDPRDNSTHKAVSLETDDSYYLVIMDKMLKKKANTSFDDEEETFFDEDGNNLEGDDFQYNLA